MAEILSIVWMVLKTKCPVTAALTAILAVSLSLISPAELMRVIDLNH